MKKFFSRRRLYTWLQKSREQWVHLGSRNTKKIGSSYTTFKRGVHIDLMSIKSYKSPEFDGFQLFFFKMFWTIVSDDTLLVLISKIDHPISYKDLRPITLCNMVNKIISKVSINRLRPFLIDLSQFAVMKRRL
ncbi:hypothetical protein CR513_63088, partial [Mucuna pruriens]